MRPAADGRRSASLAGLMVPGAFLGALLLTTAAATPPVAAESRPQAPLAGPGAPAGERLEYRVRWGLLAVARASLEVEAAPEGRLVLRAAARTRGWIDPIYPVRDLVESTVEAATLRPLRFFKRTKEGHGRPREVAVEFDAEAAVARYVRDGEERQPFALPEKFQDPLSCIYAYRARAPGAGGVVELVVTDGKRLVVGEFREVGRERLRTPAGEFDTVVVEPTIEGIGGVFRKSRKAELRIWFTDDDYRRPVRFYTEVAVGSFTMELTALSGAPTPPTDSSRRRR